MQHLCLVFLFAHREPPQPCRLSAIFGTNYSRALLVPQHEREPPASGGGSNGFALHHQGAGEVDHVALSIFLDPLIPASGQLVKPDAVLLIVDDFQQTALHTVKRDTPARRELIPLVKASPQLAQVGAFSDALSP